MAVDVQTEIEIGRPRDEVAGHAADQRNAPSSYARIQGVEWKIEPPFAFGSPVAFVATS